jgi:death on curing protein
VTEPEWFTYEQAVAAHATQLRRYGGAPGLREEGALRSALDRPVNKWHYENAELADLAAAYAFGLAKNHPKRIAFIAMGAFLRKNGIEFRPDQAQSTAIILAVAAGEVSDDSLARWIRDNWPDRQGAKSK